MLFRSAKHLTIRDERNQLIGTYRVTLSTDVENFESEEDFEFSELRKKPGIKAELAWACVHPEHRDGKVIHMLWRALTEYFKRKEVRYVFGLASVASKGAEQILDIISYLKKENFILTQSSIQARHSYFSEKTLVMERAESSIKKRLLPGLLRAYLMAGALVCLQPVFDPDLDCFDFMTVLEMENVPTSVLAHFKFK